MSHGMKSLLALVGGLAVGFALWYGAGLFNEWLIRL